MKPWLMMSDDNKPTWAVSLNFTNASERWLPEYVKRKRDHDGCRRRKIDDSLEAW